MSENDSTKEKTQKPWYRRRRIWGAVVLLLLVYFCLIPSPLKISPETTGITLPLTPDGRPDYFGYYESTWIDKLSPPEDNGQRLTIAACGPRILEQNYIAESIPWEEIATHEHSKEWFENQWRPLCEHMYIDPYARPKYLDSLGFYGFMDKKFEKKSEEEKKEIVDRYAEPTKIWEKLTAEPWKTEDHPEIADWLEKRSPVLDLFGVAVRKPNFVCWRQPSEDGLGGILLPDVQANRDFARDLRVRVAEHLGRGDVEGAWYDAMSMFHLRQHYVKDSVVVVKLVGIAIGNQGWEAAKVILKHGNPSPEQLERFASDLNGFSSFSVFDPIFEALMYVDCLHQLAQGKRGFLDPDPFAADTFYLKYLSYLPLDLNIAGKRIVTFYRMKENNRSAWGTNPALLRKTMKELDTVANANRERLKSPTQWLRIPLIRTRSELIADCLIVHNQPGGPVDTFCSDDAKFVLLRVAIALERFQKETGDYPDELEKLVPKYLDEVPLDPFTGRKTLTYKLKPEDGVSYILYSYGANGVDDGGLDSGDWKKGDIVFKR